MKLLRFGRKTLLRAIHSACVALFLAATLAARAQEAIPNGAGNVLVTGTSNSSYSFGPTSAPPLSSGGTVTIAAGTVNTIGSGSSSATYAIQVVVPATILNNGTLSASNTNNFSGGNASGLDISPLTTAGDITVTNAAGGAISASSYGLNAIALDIENVSNGSVSITNGGTLSATPGSANNITGQAATLSGIYVNDSSAPGSITLHNTGTISAGTNSSYAYGALLTTSGSGGISVVNSGHISADAELSEGYYGEGLDLTSTGSGAVAVQNSGIITGSSVTNGYGIHVAASGSGAVSIDNKSAGSISGTNSQSGYYGVAIDVADTGTGAVTINNSGTLAASATGLAAAINVADTGTGAVSVINTAAGLLSINSSSGSAYGITVTTAGKGSISNSQSLTINGVGTSSGLYLSATSGTLANSGKITVSGSGSYAASSGLQATATGNLTVSNEAGATITSSSARYGYGINASSSAGTLTLGNAAAIIVTDSVGNGTGILASGATVALNNSGNILINSSNGQIFGIQASSSGTLSLTNSGAINSAVASGETDGIDASGIGNTSVTTQGTKTINVSSSFFYPAIGIVASSSAGDVSVSNQQTVIASGIGASGAIMATGQTGALVVNSGDVENLSTGDPGVTLSASSTDGEVIVSNVGSVTGFGNQNYGNITGVSAFTNGPANVAIRNSGTIGAALVTSSGNYLVIGIDAMTSAQTGDISVTNTASGTISATIERPSMSSQKAIGLSVQGGTGSITINNAGSISGIDNSRIGSGYGIDMASGGPITVNNTGSIRGTTYGIYLNTAGTVNNGGSVRGGTNSIYVPTGSTVNLTGNASISGLIKGGANDTSTSLLNFNLLIRTNYAATAAALNAAILQYDAAHAAAASGANVDSIVFAINGSSYKFEDFDAVQDNLSQFLYANTPGFRSLGAALDNLNNQASTSPQSAQIANALGNVPVADLPATLAELSPKELEVFRNVAFDNNTFNVAEINNHLANLRDGDTGFDSSQLTIQDPGMDPSLNEVRSHLLAYDPAPANALLNDSTESLFAGMDSKDMKSAQINTEATQRWSSFIAGDVILANLNNNSNLEDGNYTTGSVTAGVDYRLDRHFTVGALFAYSHTDADLDSRGSSATVDSYSPGIYASYVDGGWYANGLGAYDRNAYTEDREINIPGLTGDNHGATSGNEGSVNLTGGYEFQKGAFRFGPVASLQYVHLAIQSIGEQGPAALNIANQDQDSFRTLLGWEARYAANVATPMGVVTLTPHVSASWQHEYLDNSDGITSQFNGTGGGSFSVQTDTPDRDSAFVDGGLDATIAANVTFFIDYEAQAGQNDFFAQSARGGVRIGF